MQHGHSTCCHLQALSEAAGVGAADGGHREGTGSTAGSSRGGGNADGEPCAIQQHACLPPQLPATAAQQSSLAAEVPGAVLRCFCSVLVERLLQFHEGSLKNEVLVLWL